MSRLTTFLRRYRVHLAVVLASGLFAAIFVTIALSGLHKPTPHHLPVAVVAPSQLSAKIQQGLGSHAPGGFSLRPADTSTRARDEVEHHDVDAALIAGSGGLRLLTAGAGGQAPTTTITDAFTALATTGHQHLTVTDIVPPGSDDSEALSAFFLILCVLFPSLATGVAVGHGLRRTALAPRIAVLVGVAGIAGLAAGGLAAAISDLHPYWEIAGIVALFSLAISSPTAALGQIRPHLAALCVLAFLIFGIPVSGGPPNLAAYAPHYLRWLEPGLPLGTAVSSIRDTVYFDNAHTTGHLLVLAAYVVGALVALCELALWTARREQRPSSDASLDPLIEPQPGF